MWNMAINAYNRLPQEERDAREQLCNHPYRGRPIEYQKMPRQAQAPVQPQEPRQVKKHSSENRPK